MDEADVDTLKNVKMGADNNPSATSKLVTLQTRKQALEEKIATKNKELRQLCIREAELTGVMPLEIPLDPGETLPTIRRRVGTSFEYPQNIINTLCNEEESISALETQIQVQRKIAEAALQLASTSTISKSIKRKNMSLYRQTKQQLEFMEETLENLKGQSVQSSSSQNLHLKQKKKPRPPLESDNISNKSNSLSQNEEINMPRNVQNVSRTEPSNLTSSEVEADRYMFANKYNTMYKNSNPYLTEGDIYNANLSNYSVPEDGGVVTALNRLSVNSYVGVKDRRSSESSNNPYMQTSYAHSHSNPNVYQHQQQQQQMIIANSHTLPHGHTAQAPPSQYQAHAAASHPNLSFPVHSHALHQPNSRHRSHPSDIARKYATENFRNGYTQDAYSYSPPLSHPHPHPYPHPSTYVMHLSPSPVSASYKQFGYVESNGGFVNVMNPQHIMSHQQYEPEMSLSAGLGGHWMKTETGEMIWCPTMQHDDSHSTWQADKRFGSLDRRKGKHVPNKRTSPCLDTISISKQPSIRSVVNPPQELTRQMIAQSSSGTVRTSRHDNRQLVRTQSLGSVGTQTVDSVWPSDDNSSYDSDGHSINELNATSRRLKEKGWCETSLDGPAIQSSQHPVSVPEEAHSPVQVPVSPQLSLPVSSNSPRTPKLSLEIPAESNPSPMHLETNIELYNNNVLTDLPKNCTVVQAGQCKPYREVTKPFEMSDFYKYSTKFRDRNQDKVFAKQENGAELSRNQEHQHFGSPQGHQLQLNSQDTCDGLDDSNDVFQKGVYQPLQPMTCQPLSPASNLNRSTTSMGNPGCENAAIANASLDSSLALNTSNVAEHFSAEMNAWYQSHGQGRPTLDNNNHSSHPVSPVSLGRSTATLV